MSHVGDPSGTPKGVAMDHAALLARFTGGEHLTMIYAPFVQSIARELDSGFAAPPTA